MGRPNRYGISGVEELLWTVTIFMAIVKSLNETLSIRCNKYVIVLTVNCQLDNRLVMVVF